MNRCITFVHVPKTAGTFLKHYFKHIGVSLRITHNTKNDFNDNNYLFALVRNPWAWQVSLYFHLRENSQNKKISLFIEKYPTFTDFIMKLNDNIENETFQTECVKLYGTFFKYFSHFHNSLVFHAEVSNEIYINYVGKVETLNEDIKTIFYLNNTNSKSFKSPNEFYNEINEKNRGLINMSTHEHYSTYYTEETKQLVYNNNKKIIDIFDYEFKGKL